MMNKNIVLYDSGKKGIDWAIDRGDHFAKVCSERLPKNNCKRCFGRGYTGTFTTGTQKGLLIPCRCIGELFRSELVEVENGKEAQQLQETRSQEA
jgi:hypothetical protein